MTRPARRRVNGDGSITKRADGRWMGRYHAWTTAGTRKRVAVYGKTRKEAAEKMREAQERNRQGIPVPDRTWKLGDWLDYWLEHVVSLNRRPATYRLYEMTIRLYLKPGLGSSPLTRLSASRAQAFFNEQLAAGRSIRTVQVMRTVLSSALSRAMREELVVRNVARLAELPTWERKPITPWTEAEARAFLDAAKKDPLYPAFMLLLLYGLRRGEVLGLRWRDLDEDDREIRVRQQVQRIKGELRLIPLKTAAGRRDLPLLPIAQTMLDLRRQAQAADRAELGRARSITFGTRPRRCSRTSASRPATLRSSLATHGWLSRLRSTPTRTARPTATPSAASAKHWDTETSCPRPTRLTTNSRTTKQMANRCQTRVSTAG